MKEKKCCQFSWIFKKFLKIYILFHFWLIYIKFLGNVPCISIKNPIAKIKYKSNLKIYYKSLNIIDFYY